MRNLNANGLALIKSFEGFRSHPYQDSGGVWTIGYGHTLDIAANTAPITEVQAEVFLCADLSHAQMQVQGLITVPLGDNQYAALVSLTYNAGIAPLEGTLGHLLNAGNYVSAAGEFQKWVYADGKINNGLVRRRAAEKGLFTSEN